MAADAAFADFRSHIHIGRNGGEQEWHHPRQRAVERESAGKAVARHADTGDGFFSRLAADSRR